MKKILSLILLTVSAITHVAAKELPENAIPFIYDQHVYVQGVLNDSIPVTIIYDTGASCIYLDKDFVAKSSLHIGLNQNATAILSGAGNSDECRVNMIVDPMKITLGNWKYKDEYSPIIELRNNLGKHVDALIGNNAFKKALMINYSNEYLLPLKRTDPKILEGYVQLPALFKDDRIFVEAELKIDSVQTLKGNFLLDLGSGTPLILTNHTQKSLDFSDKKTAEFYSSNLGIGGDGTLTLFRADSFKFLDELCNIVVYSSHSDKGALSHDNRYIGIIGNPILCHYDLIIDFATKKLYAKKSTSLDNRCHIASQIQMGYVDRTDICDGWKVISMYDKGIAQAAGIEIGDIVISINDRPVKEISWEEQRRGLGLSGETIYKVRKANGEIVTYTLNVQDEII